MTFDEYCQLSPSKDGCPVSFYLGLTSMQLNLLIILLVTIFVVFAYLVIKKRNKKPSGR